MWGDGMVGQRRLVGRLSARAAATLAKPGRHADGGGLYLVVDDSGARRWVFLFSFAGKRREMGLGGFNAIGLARARELAAQAREQVALGIDPVAARKAEREPVAPPHKPTFGEIAEGYVETNGAVWKNAKHRAQWGSSLRTYAPEIWSMPVDAVTTEHVLAAITPIWHTKAETARRVRGRLETILDAAKVRGLRDGENPARWGGHLDHLLPGRVKTKRHFAALPWQAVPAFVADLRGQMSMSALALEFIILTAARSGEALHARWDEVVGDVWVVPAERMKAGREHRVPLSSRALAILDTVRPHTERTGFVFPNPRTRKPLSENVFRQLYERMGYRDITTHGFRSSFRDWAGDATGHPREVIEAALAHAVGDETERAYRRGDALTKRRALMAEWCGFLG
jgi:integrase